MQELPSVEKILKEEGLVCHAFSPDGSLCAVSLRKSHTIEIYRLEKSSFRKLNAWKYECQLREHQQIVSDLSFSVNNKLLSVSHDKSILVWSLNAEGKWIKETVHCENKLGFLKCCWSPNGKKFAAGSGDRNVYLGYFDTINNWWSTLAIKGPKSSISALCFHPSSKTLFIGSMDFTARLISVNISVNFNDTLKTLKDTSQETHDKKGVKAESVEDHSHLYQDQLHQEDAQYDGKFPLFDTYNEILLQVDHKQTGGWIEAAAFSPDGQTLAFAVHNSTVQTISISGDGQCVYKEVPLYLKNLPIRVLLFKDDSNLIAGDYEGHLLLIQNSGGNLTLIKQIDAGNDQSSAAILKNKVGSATQMWEKRSQVTSTNSLSDKGHTNPVLCLQRYPITTECVLSSNDINGNIFFWNI